MPNTLKIAHFISSGGFYGAENMLANLLGGLRELDADVVLYVMDNAHNSHLEIATRAEALGVPVTLLRCTGRFDRGTAKTLRAALLAARVTVLHTHGYKADLYGFWATRSTGIALVSTCHNWTKASLSLRIYCALDKLALRAFARVVAVSVPVEDELLQSGVTREKLTQIANGVATPPLSVSLAAPDATHAFTIGMATRLVEEKGIADLLTATAELSRKHENLRLHIAGDGPLRAQFKALSRSLGIESRVSFLGFVAEMQSFYRSVDLFVLPSLREGLPMSVLEAQAAARPVIASRVGAIPRVVLHEQTGLLIEPGDRPALTAALERLIVDPALRAQLGAAARTLIEQEFSAQSMSRQYLDLYREAVTLVPEESSLAWPKTPQPENCQHDRTSV